MYSGNLGNLCISASAFSFSLSATFVQTDTNKLIELNINVFQLNNKHDHLLFWLIFIS